MINATVSRSSSSASNAAAEEEQEFTPILQLIYISAETYRFDPEDLKILLQKARENNEQLGISGMLVYHEGSFLQILEGPEEDVMALYNKINRDRRHGEVKLLLRSVETERKFHDWSMGFVNIDDEGTTRKLTGFKDFFRRGFSIPAMREESGLVGRVLREFRDNGKWRAAVDA